MYEIFILLLACLRCKDTLDSLTRHTFVLPIVVNQLTSSIVILFFSARNMLQLIALCDNGFILRESKVPKKLKASLESDACLRTTIHKQQS